MKRRDFLKLAAGALASVGLKRTDFFAPAMSSSPRRRSKLAILAARMRKAAGQSTADNVDDFVTAIGHASIARFGESIGWCASDGYCAECPSFESCIWRLKDFWPMSPVEYTTSVSSTSYTIKFEVEA